MSNPFDPSMLGNMGGLMGMLGGVQQKMEEMKKKTADTLVEGQAGGVVRVKISCDFQVKSVTIDPKAMGDREMLEDLVRVAFADATDKARAELAAQMKNVMGGLPIPPGLLGF